MTYTIRVRRLEGEELERDGDLFNPWELHCPELVFTHFASTRESAISHARGLVYLIVGNRPTPPESVSFKVEG